MRFSFFFFLTKQNETKKDYGIAFKQIEKGDYRMAIAMDCNNDSVELMQQKFVFKNDLASLSNHFQKYIKHFTLSLELFKKQENKINYATVQQAIQV